MKREIKFKSIIRKSTGEMYSVIYHPFEDHPDNEEAKKCRPITQEEEDKIREDKIRDFASKINIIPIRREEKPKECTMCALIESEFNTCIFSDCPNKRREEGE